MIWLVSPATKLMVAKVVLDAHLGKGGATPRLGRALDPTLARARRNKQTPARAAHQRGGSWHHITRIPSVQAHPVHELCSN